MTSDQARCLNRDCTACFPILDGIPVLINDKNSVFSVEDFVQRRNTTFILRPTRWTVLLERLLDLLPDVTLSVHATRNYRVLGELLLGQSRAPQLLVLGGSIPGEGIQSLVRDAPSIEVINTDVSFGPLTALVCDAHDIPFDDATFDGVVAQAVLEHVVDPHRCVQEIHRVLKPGGLVYAETPFMQQVHMGRYDFARFTHSGHRRLFRHFSEIKSGPISGPGTALAWSYQYFLLSFTRSRLGRGVLRAVARSTGFFLKYFDYYLIDKAGAYDAAAGVFFLGRKEDTVLSDRELIRYYKGAQVG
jgi:SAM-dependent methyltransferase